MKKKHVIYKVSAYIKYTVERRYGRLEAGLD